MLENKIMRHLKNNLLQQAMLRDFTGFFFKGRDFLGLSCQFKELTQA